jgi:hypothetical protein
MDNNVQHQEPEHDPATAAFARLEGEVGVVRRLVAANDQSATLGEIITRLDGMRDAFNVLARRPAMKLTPDEMAVQIVAAGETARKADGATIAQARDRIDTASRQMARLIGTAATIREQRRRLVWAAGGGALAAAMLLSVLPGTIARSVPARWHWPEKMAARVLRLDRWAAGEHLLATADPERWRTVVFGNSIVQDRQKALANCLRMLGKTSRPPHCIVTIAAPQSARPGVAAGTSDSR